MKLLIFFEENWYNYITMAIILKNVELQNIRSHDSVQFTPEPEGITLLSGANGTGKSSIVDSIAWALFGTKPEGVAKNVDIVKNGTNLAKEKAYVIVDIELESRHFCIERKIVNKSGTVECNVWEYIKDEDENTVKTHVAGPAVSHTEQYIRRIMKMDEKGFLAAVLVQQKQVDKLIAARAKERANIIEKLTGISSVTLALTNSRQESNALKKTSDLYSIDEKDVEDLRKKVEKLENDESIILKKLNKVEEDKKSSLSDVDSLRESLSVESKKIEEFEKLKNDLVNVEAYIESHRNLLNTAIEEKDSKKSEISRLVSGADSEELEKQVRDIKNSIRQFEQKKAVDEKELKDLRIKLGEYQELVEKSSIKELSAAEEGLEKNNKRILQIQSTISDNQASIISSQTEIKKLEKAISILQNEHGKCPTCLQNVDDVSVAVHTLDKQKQTFVNNIEKVNEELDSLRLSQVKAEGIKEKFVVLVEALSQISIVEERERELQKNIDDYIGSIKSYDVELQASEKIYREVLQNEEKRKDYKRLLERAQKISKDLDHYIERQDTIKQSIQQSGVISSKMLERMREKYNKAVEKNTALSIKYSDYHGEWKLVHQELSFTKENLSKEEEALLKHQDMKKSVEISYATTKLIEEFRENRINNSIPVIESYASDLINRFTEGKFIGLKMDSNFNTKVILNNNVERSVGLLSGGELSAAAMALRLAISMLLNGSSSHNLIVLDEVLVSQDSERAELILSTIKDVCKGQVVLIAHNDIANSVADKIVDISKISNM